MLDPGVVTLAEILRERGFTTAAIMNNPFLDPSFGVARGFELYDYEPGDNQSIRRADRISQLALEWLDARTNGRFLLVLHFFDPHMNYDPPPAVRGTFTGDLPSSFGLPIGTPVTSLPLWSSPTHGTT